MKNIHLSYHVILGALKGALLSIIGTLVIVSIVGIPFGGPLVALYFFPYLVVFAGLVGGFLGTLWTAYKLFRQGYTNMTDVIWLGLPILLIAGLVAVLYIFDHVDKTVVHGADWDTKVDPRCEEPAIILMLTEYATYEVVCSPELQSYLTQEKPDVIPITYRVTYSFGDISSYRLIKVGPVALDWDQWFGGVSGCGTNRPYLPACGSEQARNSSPLEASSWTEE